MKFVAETCTAVGSLLLRDDRAENASVRVAKCKCCLYAGLTAYDQKSKVSNLPSAETERSPKKLH